MNTLSPDQKKKKQLSHMQLGLPQYYAVAFDYSGSRFYAIDALSRYNKIHKAHFAGGYLFYGYDGSVACLHQVTQFKQPVTVLTVAAFLSITDEHFKTAKP